MVLNSIKYLKSHFVVTKYSTSDLRLANTMVEMDTFSKQSSHSFHESRETGPLNCRKKIFSLSINNNSTNNFFYINSVIYTDKALQ